RDYGKAIREIGSLADFVNQYTDRYKPWDLAKNSEKNDELHRVCSILLNAFFTLTVYLKPILPSLAKKVEHFLNLPREIRW
ncbi:methionine--tRNA ligase, partial [Salmonella enterica subsp. enterica serovar Typhimurium]|nr:methionine--tRNA ligase [Salmonella enterica subsp. enterica serovar Typhimurium]